MNIPRWMQLLIGALVIVLLVIVLLPHIHLSS